MNITSTQDQVGQKRSSPTDAEKDDEFEELGKLIKKQKISENPYETPGKHQVSGSSKK